MKYIFLYKYKIIMQIFYGIDNLKIDVTEYCLKNLEKNNVIFIPSEDFNRSTLFSDPVINVLKKIFILNNNILTEYDSKVNIKINLINNSIITENDEEINNKLINIQSKLKIKYGTFNEEFPEQIMAVTYLSGNEKVLEIGSNIGRNSLIIGYILENNNNHNFVTLETDTEISKQLCENRDLNNLHFHIENSALSKRKLIQRGWDTIESDILLDGYKSVNTITFNELILKYNINFDTLVLDCEGAFYYILIDMPEILENINLIIMENDYWDINKKKYIDDILLKNNFYVDYSRCGGWGPCCSNFFEVWKKNLVTTNIDLPENDLSKNDLPENDLSKNDLI